MMSNSGFLSVLIRLLLSQETESYSCHLFSKTEKKKRFFVRDVGKLGNEAASGTCPL